MGAFYFFSKSVLARYQDTSVTVKNTTVTVFL
ncbi:MAG: hypothetical protein ACI93R_003093 [Flavobacteriales bacterium]|jgi:hypothetical protein